MNIVSTYWKLLFPDIPTSDQRSDDREFGRDFTARRARGNVALQAGKYVTEQEIEESKRDIAAHKFRAR